MEAKANDYVQQGEDRFWLPTPAVRCNLNSNTCSCKGIDCSHLGRVRIVMLTERGEQFTQEQNKWLVDRLRGTGDELTDAIAELLHVGLESISYNELRLLKLEAELFFGDRIFYCERCQQWVDWDDGSEDVDGICLECVR